VLVDRAEVVTTHFPRPASFVALVLDGVTGSTGVPLGVQFRGARRAQDASGRELAPTVVLAGAQSVVLVDVDVDAEASDVVVRAGDDWQLAGVLAGTGDPEAVSERIASDGVDAVAARLLAVAGAGCAVSWTDPPGPRRRPAKRRATKKSTAKKQAAKKSTAKKQAAKKRAAKKQAATKQAGKQRSSAKRSGSTRSTGSGPAMKASSRRRPPRGGGR
jgi:hypothetical protein